MRPPTSTRISGQKFQMLAWKRPRRLPISTVPARIQMPPPMVPAAVGPTLRFGLMPEPAASVQIFGHDRDPGTRAAVRFFKERRVAIHLVELTRKPIARAES